MFLTDLLPALTTGWISPDSLTELAGFAARSTLLLGAGLLTSVILRLAGCSAAIRFRALWLCAAGVPLLLAGSLLGNFMESAAPLRLRFPEIPAWTGRAAGKSMAPAMEHAERENPSGDQAAVSASPENFRTPQLDWRTVPAGLWLAGMSLTLSGIAWRRCRIWCWTRRLAGTCPEQERIRDLLRETAAFAGLLHSPRLFFAEGWIMPGMGGSWRPWILLPEEAGSWDKGRLKHVLLHECGHIVRHDARADFRAALALAPLWFHPLAWLFRKRLSALRELACDDWVVTRSKAEPAAYAADLLALVKRQAAEAFIRHPRGSSLMLRGPLIGMAQPSSAGLRIRQLLRGDVRRNEPGRGLTAALAAGSAILTGFCLIIVSCETTGGNKPQPALIVSTPGETRQTVSRVPEKPRPGAATIQFALLEITSSPGQRNFLTSWLPPDGKGDPAAEPLAFPSLRALARQRGVDLLTVPETTEGQEIRWNCLRTLLYPVTFDAEGGPKEFAAGETGVRLKIRGEKTPDGSAVLADVEWSVKNLSGELIHTLPDGKTVRQPLFDFRGGSRKKLPVPNGGFTILLDDDAPLTKYDEALTQEQFTRLRETGKPQRRWLALGVTSAPLPPAAGGEEPVRPWKRP